MNWTCSYQKKLRWLINIYIEISDTLSHKRNVNQNYTKISSHPRLIGNHQKNNQQEMLLMMWENEASYTI
jgi:hypothetical protein